MERLSGLDAAFLYGETPTNHMHVAALMILDPSTVPGGYSFDGVKEYLRARVDGIPQLRRRLARVPFNLHHPVWFDDPDFDIDHHVRRAAVPAPGGVRELCDFASDVAGVQLDRNRPLWEMWLVEGLEGDRVGMVAKMHHSTVDGVSGANLLVHLFDVTPEPEAAGAGGSEGGPGERQPERKPSDAELVAYALRSRLRRPLVAARVVPETLSALTQVVRRRRDPSTPSGATPLTAPRTSFNAAISSQRRVAITSVGLPDVKAVKNAFGTTVNDVVLAITTGALRRYLDQHGELPDRALVATCPMSVRAELEDDAEAGQSANLVSAMFVSLPVHVEDPVERLRAIAETTRGAKHERNAVGARMLLDWAALPAPNVFAQAARLYSRMKLADRHPVVHNLVVSNVPGPTFPLYFAGARLEALHPLGPIFDGAGLNLTVLSYLDRVGFGFIAARELVPGLDDLAHAVEESATELGKAAETVE